MKKRRYINFILLIIPAIVFNNHALGQSIPYNHEFVINTQTENWQRNPSVIRLANNNIVVSWDSHRQDGDGWGVVAQIFDSTFTKLGDEIYVNSTTEGYQGRSDIAPLTDGGFIISWNDKTDEWSTQRTIYAQFFDDQGIKNSQELKLVNIYGVWHSTQNIASLSTNRFILNWANTLAVYSQQYDMNGNDLHPTIRLASSVNAEEQYPEVASFPNNSFVIVWPHVNGIYSQMYDSTSQSIGSINEVSNSGEAPTVKSLLFGGYAVTWCINTDYKKYELYLRIYDQSGQPVTDKILVDVFTYWQYDLTYYAYRSRIMQSKDGKIIVAWVHLNGDRQEIYAKIFENNGEEYGTKFKITDNVHHNNAWIDGCTFSYNKFVICWAQEEDNNVDIYGKYYVTEPLHHDLTQFQLINSIEDSIDHDDSYTLIWEQASEQPEYLPWEVVYDVHIASDSDFREPVLICHTVDTVLTIDSLEHGKDYYWRVLSKNINGDSLWSINSSHFYIRSAPDPDDTIVNLSSENYWIYDYSSYEKRWDPPVPDVIKHAVVKSDIHAIYYKDNLKYATIRNTIYYDNLDKHWSKLLSTWKTDSNYLIISSYFGHPEDTIYYPLDKQGLIVDSVEISDKVFLRQKIKSYYYTYIVSISYKHAFETVPVIGPLMMNFQWESYYSNNENRWELSSAFINGEHFHIRPHRPIAVKAEIQLDQLKLDWHKNLNEEVIGYHIYGGYSTDPDSIIATMSSRQDTIFILPYTGIDSLYYIGVSAFDKDYMESKKNIVQPELSIKTLSPVEITEHKFTPDTVEIKWSPLLNNIVTGYNIYVSNEDNQFILYKMVNNRTTFSAQFGISDLLSQTSADSLVKCMIRAYNSSGEEGQNSNVYIINQSELSIKSLNPVEITEHKFTPYTVEIKWSPLLINIVMGYNIYVSNEHDQFIRYKMVNNRTTFSAKFGISGLLSQTNADSILMFMIIPYNSLGEEGQNSNVYKININNQSKLFPDHIILYQNYPNPFNSSTVIEYYLNNDENIDFTIFDIKGAKIKTMYHGKQDKGIHTIKWDGTNNSGIPVAQGLYIYQLKSANTIFRKKMMMIK